LKNFILISKALGDETRVRALMSLSQGELCLCQIVELLSLAPSTVSKHMSTLYAAGLVNRRKQGRWHYFSLAGSEAGSEVRQALKWVRASLKEDETILRDAAKIARISKIDPEKFALCYCGPKKVQKKREKKR